MQNTTLVVLAGHGRPSSGRARLKRQHEILDALFAAILCAIDLEIGQQAEAYRRRFSADASRAPASPLPRLQLFV
jgi:hypothetical protein